MRLARPFYQLPILFDVAQLQADVAALPDEAWVPHPDGVPGNSAVRLISARGAETDVQRGQMLPTQWLAAMPYLRQVLAGFGVVWSRSRLMRLAPGARVPPHADIAYHWHTRVRLHIPVFTRPQVHFHCDDQCVHMAAGEAWIFDNWRRHHVENGADEARIHLVADTTGTAAFWRFACAETPPRAKWLTLPWDPSAKIPLLTESQSHVPIMPAAEVELLIHDLCDELATATKDDTAKTRMSLFQRMLHDFVLDWRQLCALHGVAGNAHDKFEHLVRSLHASIKPLAQGLFLSGNKVGALLVLEQRVLRELVRMPPVHGGQTSA